jgi:hypothetical protein
MMTGSAQASPIVSGSKRHRLLVFKANLRIDRYQPGDKRRVSNRLPDRPADLLMVDESDHIKAADDRRWCKRK